MTTPYPVAAASASSSSHQALLGIIEEKERELIRIRHAANTAAEEEKKNTHKKIIDLQSDHEHNVKILHDKDEEIKALQCKIHSMEVEYMTSKREIEDRCEQMMNRHVEQMEYRTREEMKERRDQYEQEQRKKLQIEYENKLSEKERNLQIDYQRSLIDELKDQEGRIERKFEKMMDERESERRDVEREWKIRLTEKEREASDMCREFEVRWRDQEQSLVRDLQTKHESKMTMELDTLKNEYKRYMSDQEHEIDKVLRDVQRLEKDKVRLEEEKDVTEGKVGELLNMVQCMEKGYGEKTFEYEQEIRGLQLRLMQASEQISAMEADIRRREVGYRTEIDKLKRQNKDDRKASRMKIRELKRELISANEERDEKKQSLAATEGEVERSKKRLKDKVASMTQECICLRDEIRCLNEKVTEGEHNESFQREEQRRILSEQKAADAHARKKIMEQFERTIQKDREDFDRERLQLKKERDEALLGKESANTELGHWREEVSRVKGHYTSMINQQREDVDVLRRENNNLKMRYNEERQGNVHLKNTLADMRREMEELMAVCSSATATSNGQGEELPSVSSSRDQSRNSILDENISEFKKDIAKVKR